MSQTLPLPRVRLWCIAVVAALVAPLGLSGSGAIATYSFGEQIDESLVTKFLENSQSKLSVIVTKKAAQDTRLERRVSAAGGRLERPLPMVDGFEATIPASILPEISRDPNLRSLSENRTGKFSSVTWDDSTLGQNSNAPRAAGALPLWGRGNYGSGVGVALIDTGVSPMNDLTAASGYRIVHGPDLSGENSLIDTYGHGTVMAGLIAGDGYDSRNVSGGAYVGLAPRAWIVSVKVAGANGSTDVSNVLAAMHWVASYRDQYNIRIVNLSWGTPSTQSYRYDPLNYAVERLWSLGITVVVASGNSGPGAGTITKPGDDPFVITVGALNTNQNTDPLDDSVPGWSSRGPTAADGIAKPDVVAPGRLLVSTRSYDSTVEKTYPKALYSPAYIRGSGSSQAAAVTSGAIALMLRQKPHLSPAQVKHMLMSTASPIPGVSSSIQGAGRISISAAADSADESYANVNTPPSNGLGSLEASRGGRHVQTDCDGDGNLETIEGEITVQCQAWDGVSWTGVSWTGDSWTGVSWTGSSFQNGTWDGVSWTGGDWQGVSWTGGSWTGVSWTGVSWTGGSWEGVSWTNQDFTGVSWTGVSWTGVSWTGVSWTGGNWTGVSWTGVSWTGVSWTGVSWTGVSWTDSAWTTGSYEERFLLADGTLDPIAQIVVLDVNLMTAFWGDNPPAGIDLEGELSEDEILPLTITSLL